MPKSAYGFTLVELMVVIAITAVIGVYTLANFTNFGEDQNLNNAVLDLQSFLRQAQTNATTNVICDTKSGATWKVVFSADNRNVDLKCEEPGDPADFPKKILNLAEKDQNLLISAVSGTGSICPAAASETEINFAPLNGNIDFNNDNYSNCSSLQITLKNSQTGTTKNLKIEKGGRIYVP